MKFKHFAAGLLAPMLLISCGKVTADTGNTSSEANKNEYTITWKNYDDSILEVDTNVEEGTLPTYDGATPKKPSDGNYTYTFDGWNPEVAIATSDQTYTAKYTANMTSQSGCLFFYPKTGTLYRGLAKPSYKYAVSRAKSDVATVGLSQKD